jgi:regulatory protein YycI of two-component signal transduction system YycFG
MYLCIVEVTDNKKLGQYQPCKTEAEAIAHSEKYGGFVVKDIGGNYDFWIVDKDKKTVTQDTVTENNAITKKNIMNTIKRLEETITSRRYRDAIAGTDDGWLANQEKLIAVERGKL